LLQTAINYFNSTTMNNKKAQLSIEKTRYSLYSSGCSTDLQDHLYVIWKPTCDFPL